MKKIPLFIILLFLVVVFALPASASAAANAGVKPGSFFYFFDTAFEKVNLFFTFNPEKKARKALEYADERLAEVGAVAKEENTNAIKTAVAGYESNIALAAKESKQIKNKEKAEGLLTSITDNASKHQEILSDVLNKVPDEAKEAITKAILASRKGQEEATKQIVQLKGEVEQLKREVAELKTKDEAQTKADEELSRKKSESASMPVKSPTPPTSETIQNKPATPNQSQTLPKANEPQSTPSANQQPTDTIASPSQTQNQIQAPQLPSYKLSILSFEPTYADIDYETPPNRALNHYKIDIQFSDENNVVNSIDGNFKIFLENEFFHHLSSNLLVYDNFKEAEIKLSNPFIFKYTLTRFPKNQNELDNYFLTATYKDQRYRIPIGNYFNFERIPECDQVVSDFYNDSDVKRILSYYQDKPTEPIKKYLNLAKEKQCYKSLRYQEMRSCFANFPNYGFSSSMCTTLKENSM
ncbi:MAG: DUF5667 domain-containing protein [bacterium]|nr:DUF5667 domain-containing protein [bacterium]